MKKNNCYIFVKELNISTTKTSVEYAHQAHANAGFFWVSVWLVYGRSPIDFDVNISHSLKSGVTTLHKRYYAAMWLKRMHLKQFKYTIKSTNI